MDYRLLIFGAQVFYFITGTQSQEARCDVIPNSDLIGGPNVTGVVHFSVVDGGSVSVSIELFGFNNTDDIIAHGFHIHESGDLSQGCTSTDSHYNPEGVDHGGRLNETRHVGDLGNIYEDDEGNIFDEFDDDIIKLEGEDNNILNRAVVIHETLDDLGESGDPAGAAGARLACCVIKKIDDDNGAESISKYNLLLVFTSWILSVAAAHTLY